MSNTTNQNYKIYCLSFNNPERKETMKRRFLEADIEDVIFGNGVNFEDDRIKGRDIPDSTKRVWSCMYGHLDMINDFYQNTDKEFGIFCEDDICVRKNLKIYLPRIMFDFKCLNLDVLLLGYLVTFRVTDDHSNFQRRDVVVNNSIFKYYDFPNHVWGTQMYMLSRTSAKKILDKYYNGSNYADQTIKDDKMTPFSADWTLTKDGNRALITPIMVVEDNMCRYENNSQGTFHEDCHKAHYVKGEFTI